jgi:hypothetical protein
MPTPAQGYTLADGSKIPGTTTVLGASLGWSKGPLMAWAHRMGQEGKSLYGERDAAADIGTLAHEAAECHIKGTEFIMPPVSEEAAAKVRSAFEAYMEWREDSRIDVVGSEIRYVSEQYKYGGTLDGIGSKQGRPVLIDFKTSNGTYAEHLIQLAAYHHLHEEVTGQTFERWHLLRFGKERGDFHHHSYKPIPEAWEAFKHLRALYDLKRPLETLA